MFWCLALALAQPMADLPGRWYPVGYRSPTDDPSLSKAQRAELAALEALGYADRGERTTGRTGVVVRTDEAAQGLNLYSSGHRPEALLIDMDGRVLHRWHRPFADSFPKLTGVDQASANTWRRVALLPDGGLLAIHEGIGLVCLNRDSSIRWSSQDRAHHDLEVLPDGRILVLTRVARVLDGQPVLEDFVATLSPNGEELQRISVLGALKTSPWGALLSEVPTEVGGDWLHTNALHLLDGRVPSYHPQFQPGHLLLSARHLDLIMVMDPATQQITYATRGPWTRQHDIEVGPSGKLWMFDNRGAGDHSRVLALDPSQPTNVVWSWSEGGALRSDVLGAVQELPNGNVLVTQSTAGRAVEVTKDGQVVWDFRNPEVDEKYVAVVFEMIRLPVTSLGWLE